MPQTWDTHVPNEAGDDTVRVSLPTYVIDPPWPAEDADVLLADQVTDAEALRAEWYLWRIGQRWRTGALDLAAKVAEEAGEVLGATLKLDQQGRAGTHPDHDRDHLAQEIGQLVGTILCLAEHFGIDPLAEAAAELERVKVRFPVPPDGDAYGEAPCEHGTPDGTSTGSSAGRRWGHLGGLGR